MIIQINREKYLTEDLSLGSDIAKANIIENTQNEFLGDLIISFSDERFIYFMDRDELTELIKSSNIIEEHYDANWEHFVENSIPVVGTTLIEEMGLDEDTTTFFIELVDEAWEVLGDLAKESEVPQTQGWRLPAVEELMAMYSREEESCIEALKTSKREHFWASTSASVKDKYWYMYINNGTTFVTDKEFRTGVCYVRDAEDDILELVVLEDSTMTWEEANEFGKELVAEPKKIVYLKLNGLLYEEVKITKPYTVRVEVGVQANRLCEIKVNATNEKDAKLLAIALYEDNPYDPSYETWEAEGEKLTVQWDTMADWEVKEDE